MLSRRVRSSIRFDSIHENLKNFDDMIRLKESRLNAIKKSFEDCSKKLGECDKEIILKRERLKLIQSSSELVSK